MQQLTNIYTDLEDYRQAFHYQEKLFHRVVSIQCPRLSADYDNPDGKLRKRAGWYQKGCGLVEAVFFT